MEDQVENQAKVLVELQNVQVFRLLNNTRMKLCEGTLKVGNMISQDISFLNVNDFYYTLQRQIPFLQVNHETQINLIFPHIDQGFTGLVIPLANEEVHTLNQILSATVSLQSQQEVLQNEQLSQRIKTHCENIFSIPLVEDSKVIHVIGVAGSQLKKGLGWLGGLVASGVNKGGSYLSEKITKTEKKEVSQETKEKYDNIKQKSAQTMQVAGSFVSSVFNPILSATGQYISEKSKDIDQGDNETLKKIKNITSATGKAVGDAFSGLVDGAKQVGTAVSTNTRVLVEKKYGDDVTNTFMGPTDQVAQQQQQQQLNKDDVIVQQESQQPVQQQYSVNNPDVQQQQNLQAQEFQYQQGYNQVTQNDQK